MSDIKKINQSDYVTVQGQYAVINEGTGYAIINIQTNQIAARNISSFLDCVKTLEYMIGNSESQEPIQYPIPDKSSSQNKLPNFGLKPDVQQLIEKYAPTTERVKKKVHLNRSRYKCYDASGSCLGRVKGKLGDRYWEDRDGSKRY